MKKILGALVAVSLFAPFAVMADSTVTATATNGASVTPSGSTLVLTGVTQVFSFTGATNVKVDGVSQGSLNTYNFVGDLSDHTIDAMGATGGGMLYCSGPMAPGWNVSLPYGGCGAPKAPVYLPTVLVHLPDGSSTLRIAQ